MTNAPHLAITMSKDSASAMILRILAQFSGQGISAIKANILNGQPVINVEMFSNEYYDNGAQKLVKLMDALTEQHAKYDVYELPEGETFETADLALCLISPETFRNIVTEGDNLHDKFENERSS